MEKEIKKFIKGMKKFAKGCYEYGKLGAEIGFNSNLGTIPPASLTVGSCVLGGIYETTKKEKQKFGKEILSKKILQKSCKKIGETENEIYIKCLKESV